MRKNLKSVLKLSAMFVLGVCAVAKAAPNPEAVQLGKALFFDTRLSFNHTMNCATCHNPGTAFVDRRETEAKGVASMGADGHSFGGRNAPTAAYASFSPKFHYDKKLKQYVGGQFLDGRAATLADQAEGPPLNPVEMAMPDVATIVARVKEQPYYVDMLTELYGEEIWDSPEAAYSAMAKAIQAYEESEDFSSFDSKYDRYLRGEYEMTDLEELGRTLFFSNNNVTCAQCHLLETNKESKYETFTNYQYHNIGVPSNAELKALINNPNYVDNGLAENPAVKDKAAQRGKFKVSTLRNVAVTGPYMHNGVFQDLRTVVQFYNHYNDPKDKINPETGKPWAKPEVDANISHDLLKMQALTPRKIDALVAFMETLTDKRYEPLLQEIKAKKHQHKK